MEDIHKLIGIARLCKNKWVGLDALIGVSLLFLTAITKLLPENIFSTTFLIIGQIIILVLWFVARRIPSFTAKQYGIIFATNHEIGLEHDIKSLEEEIKRILERQRLHKFISIKRLPGNIKIEGINQANKILFKSRGILVVWGEYREGKRLGKKLRGFPPGRLNFTWRFPVPILEQALSTSIIDIKKAITHKQWDMSTENDFLDHQTIADNLTEVCEYIVANVLMLFGETGKSKIILLEIQDAIRKRKIVKRTRKSNQFLESLRRRIAACLFKECSVFHNTRIFDGNNFLYNESSLKEQESKLLLLRQYSIRGEEVLSLAIVYFLMGDIEKSKKILRRAIVKGKGSAEHYFSLAFLEIYLGNTKEGLKRYRAALHLSSNVLPSSYNHMISFTEACLRKVPGKFHLHLSLGILYMEFQDSLIAKGEFNEFIKLSKGTDIIGESFANQQIEIMNKNI